MSAAIPQLTDIKSGQSGGNSALPLMVVPARCAHIEAEASFLLGAGARYVMLQASVGFAMKRTWLLSEELVFGKMKAELVGIV
jgi:hypothetical protein